MNDILRYLHIVYKRRFLFLSVSLLTMTLLTIVSFSIPQKYRADSTVFIERNVIDSLVKGIAVTPDMDNRIRVLRHALLSRDIITKVVKKLDYDVKIQNEAEFQNFLSELRERTGLQVKGHDLFIVSLEDNDPEFARDYINTLVSTYVEENLSEKRNETYGANRFMIEQIDIFKAKLDKAESDIIDYRQSQGLLSSANINETLDQINQHRIKIEDINLLISRSKSKLASLRAYLEKISPAYDLLNKEDDNSKEKLLERKIQALLLNYTNEHPDVIRLTSELDELKENPIEGTGQNAEAVKMLSASLLLNDTNQQIINIGSEIEALETQKQNLIALMSLKEQELQSMPDKKKKLEMLYKERESLSNIYEKLLLRMGQSEVSKQMEIGDKSTTFRIVDPAILPRVPVSPDMVKLMLLTIVLGLGSGLAAAIIRDTVDTRVMSVHDLVSAGIPVIGVIDNITDGSQREKAKRRDIVLIGSSLVYFGVILSIFIFQILLIFA